MKSLAFRRVTGEMKNDYTTNSLSTSQLYITLLKIRWELNMPILDLGAKVDWTVELDVRLMSFLVFFFLFIAIFLKDEICMDNLVI